MKLGGFGGFVVFGDSEKNTIHLRDLMFQKCVKVDFSDVSQDDNAKTLKNYGFDVVPQVFLKLNSKLMYLGGHKDMISLFTSLSYPEDMFPEVV